MFVSPLYITLVTL